MLAGGYSGSTFTGGDINIKSGIPIYGSILAGNYLSTTGNVTLTGTVFSGAQGAVTGTNSQKGSMTFKTSIGSSSSFSQTVLPCMINCTTTSVNSSKNLVWVTPI
jgi:hypothetical protein